MALNFPSNPSTNDLYTIGERTWYYTGTAWKLRLDTTTELQNKSFLVNVQQDSFTADGTSNTFTLSTTPYNENYTIVTLDGVVQHKSSYNVESSNVVFSAIPDANTEIDVTTLSRTSGYFELSLNQDSFVADGSSNTYVLTSTPENKNFTLVTINGVVQHKDAYTLSEKTITLSENPTVNSNVEVITFLSDAADYLNIGSNVLPEYTETYDLGSTDKKWKDLYLSGNTIYLGNTTISASNNDLVLPANTKIGDTNTTLPAGGAFMFRNKLINGNFDIWQRATSQTSSGYGSADRWESLHNGSTKTASQQAFALGQTDVPNNPSYFMRHVVTSVAGASNFVLSGQKIEGVETLSGKTITLSFWAKADASKNIAVDFLQYFGSGGSPSATVSGIGSQLVALTTAWAKYTITVDIPSVSGKTLGTDGNDSFRLHFWFDAGSTYDSRTASLGQQSGTFDIAQVQIEEGTAATPFEQRPFGMELSLCHRYYQHNVMYRMRYSGHGTTQVLAYAVPLKVIMRIFPSFTRTILNGGTINTEVVNADYIYTEIRAATAGQTIRITYNLDAEL